MADREKIEVQEQKDFLITNNIMTRIFQAYDAKIDMKQTKPFSAYDADMTVEKKNNKKEYIVEIKERNYDGELETLPLKVKKYCSIMEKVDNQTPLVIYLCNDGQYFIYDLTKLDLNKVEIKNWNIPKVQYSTNHQYEEQPTFFLPLNQSIYNGTFAYANNQ